MDEHSRTVLRPGSTVCLIADESVARVSPRPTKNTMTCSTIIFVSSPYIVNAEKMTDGSYCQTKNRMRLGNELSPLQRDVHIPASLKHPHLVNALSSNAHRFNSFSEADESIILRLSISVNVKGIEDDSSMHKAEH